ncbi:MAG: hypothetical protein ACI867_001875 [Glaciecola sp.]|jgi:hypothetical protein
MTRAAPGRLAIAALLLVSAIGMLVGTANAQTPPAAETSLRVARMTTLTGAGSVTGETTPPEQIFLRVLVEHVGPADLVDAQLVIESYGRLTTRSLLRQTLDDGDVGWPRSVTRQGLRDGILNTGDVAALDVYLDVSDVVVRGRSGVYPIQLSLTRGTEVLDRVVTAVVHLEEPLRNPLRTVAVWPIDLAPMLNPSTPTDDFDAQIAPGGRIDDLVAALESRPNSPFILAVSPHLLAELSRRAGADGQKANDAEQEAADQDPGAVAAAQTLTRIRALLASLPLEPVTGAYAEADLGVLAEAGPVLAEIGSEMAVEGARRLESLGGRAPDSSTFLITSPLTRRALDVVPGDHLLLPWGSAASRVPEPGEEVAATLRELRSASGRILTASVADPWIGAALEGIDDSHGTVLAVQRIVAETALLNFESPGIADRPLLILPPRDWDPGGRVARDLVPALAAAPWLDLVAPSRHAQLATDADPIVLSSQLARVPGDVVAGVGQNVASLANLAASLPPGVSVVGGREVADLDDQLRRATSHWFASMPATAQGLVDDVQSTIEAAYGEISIPAAQNVLMAGKDGEIPITISRPTGDPLVVVVEVRSGAALLWPNGTSEVRTFTAGTTQTLSFAVLARARGDISVDVIVRDLSGARILAESTIRVRSTFISRPALAIVGGVLVLLLVIGRLRKRPGEGADPDTEPLGEGGTDGRLTMVTSDGKQGTE